MPHRIGSKPSPSTVRPGGGNVIRPMYGVIIRDRLAQFRSELKVTIDDTKQAIAEGKPRGKEVFGDGILQGSELTKAKNAVKDLEKALKALKPVFPQLGNDPTVSDSKARRDLGRVVGGPIAMYGVVFRDDLSRFRNQISNLIGDIKAGLPALNSAEKAEAKKALTNLQAALKDLGTAGRAWN